MGDDEASQPGASHGSRRIEIVAPDDFSPDPPFSWRAFDSKGTISNPRLAEVLRRIADWLDQNESTE